MPFLQISSGHHQVADALIDGIKTMDPSVECDKVDILHYGYGKIEGVVSNVYLKWIAHFPQMYSWVYRKVVCEENQEDKRYRHYELLFLSVMQDIIEEKKPDIIICTHALPSYLLSILKQRGFLSIPVVNVYTDYFIHRLWGREGIDVHLVPSIPMKKQLLEKGVNEDQIYVTGIPIHHKFSKADRFEVKQHDSLHLLLTGGNLGVGLIEKFVEKVQNQKIQYSVLCGKNEKLYERLAQMNSSQITPIPFIESREKMDLLYKSCDGIITKPGGVTISESLFKRVPIFVYHTLPGQEEYNLSQLQQLGVANHLHSWDSNEHFEEEIIGFYEDGGAIETYNDYLDQYHSHIDHHEPAELIQQFM